MSGDLWQMARNGTTLLPGEARKLALAYDKMRQELDDLREMVNAAQMAETVASAELAHLRRILAALREPSNTILEAAWCECPGNFPADHNNVCDVIRVAVAAAEQEVGNA